MRHDAPRRSHAIGIALCIASALAVATTLAGSAIGARDAGQATAARATASPVFPGAEWDRIANPRTAGFCQDKLDAASAYVKTIATTSAMAIVGGRLLWEHGDTSSVSYLASVRKSVLAMMYGKYVANGTIKLDRTLRDLKITDVSPLLPSELDATILDLLGARSGVYHPASNAASAAGGDTVGEAPARGSVVHGTYFLYNNWDFNALGTIFEQETGQNLYDALERDLVRPIGMQEFSRAAHRLSGNARASMHLAYHMNFSTRDLARIGLLMLREGNWNGTPVVPREWARRIVTPVTRVADMHPAAFTKGPFGYGLLWWVWDGPSTTDVYRGAYTGIGAVGQFLTVMPALDLVISHKTQPGGASVSRPEYLALVDRLVQARCASQEAP